MVWDWRRAVKPIADKIVYASDAYVSLKSSVNDLSDALIDFSQPPQGSGDEALVDLARNLRPYTAPGLSLARVGGQHDGGYVMARDPWADRALSIGVGCDISWDIAMAENGTKVDAFDHTVRGLPTRAPGVTFHKIGLGHERGCLPLQQIVERTVGPLDAILKIDIEGAEWSALANSQLDQFPQILIELHDLDHVASDPRILELLAWLRQTHVPVHVHANNYDPLFRMERLWFCRTVEVTYVRRDWSVSWIPADAMNGSLDRPCDPRTSDISLDGLLGPYASPTSD